MFDRIVTSTNENSTYLGFWELQILAHKKFFPEKKLTIAFLTDRTYEDELVKEMISHDIDVQLYKPINGIPEGNHAKILRYICASQYNNEICCITDMDTIPLQKEYLTNQTNLREPNKLLCIGAEVYKNTPHYGKFPAHHMTAEGKIFKQLFNPNNLNYEDSVKEISNFKVFDSKESIVDSRDSFSDESLIRVLIGKNNVPVQHIVRNVDIYNDWIDRSWWNINTEKLKNFKYVESNLLRPYDKNKQQIEPILQFLKDEL